MGDTQSKTTAMLRKIAEDNGLELVVDTQWANTGTFKVESLDSLTPLLSIGYSFQPGYAGFIFRPGHGLGVRQDGELHYVKTEELMDRLIAPYTAIVTALGQKAAEDASAARRAAKVRA